MEWLMFVPQKCVTTTVTLSFSFFGIVCALFEMSLGWILLKLGNPDKKFMGN